MARSPIYALALSTLAACGGGDGPAAPPPPPPPPPVPPLSITGQAVAAVTDTSVTLTWETNHPATTTATCVGRTFQSDAASTLHEARITGLTPSTTIPCDLSSETQVASVPQSGRQATVRVNVTTAAIPNVTPPAALVLTRLLVTSPSACGSQDATPECQTDILTLSAAGATTNLTNTPNAHERQPTWSPDGQRIAFTSDRDRLEWDVYVMQANGSGVSRVSGRRPASAPQWSPDGSRLLYINALLFSAGRLCIVSVQTRAESCPVPLAQGAQWSHNGQQIAYILPDGDNTKLCILTVASGASVCGPRASYIGQGLAWSPDDAWIAFTGKSTTVVDNEKLYRVRPDLTDLSRVTTAQDRGWEHNPQWSPDGTTIVFYHSEEGIKPALHRATPATGASAALNLSSWVTVSGPHAFSRDGQFVIVSGVGVTGGAPGGLWLIRPDGTRVGRVSEASGWDSFGGWRP